MGSDLKEKSFTIHTTHMENLADIGAKALAGAKFTKLRESLGIIPMHLRGEEKTNEIVGSINMVNMVNLMTTMAAECVVCRAFLEQRPTRRSKTYNQRSITFIYVVVISSIKIGKWFGVTRSQPKTLQEEMKFKDAGAGGHKPWREGNGSTPQRLRLVPVQGGCNHVCTARTALFRSEMRAATESFFLLIRRHSECLRKLVIP